MSGDAGSIISIECQVGAPQTVDLAHVRIAIDGQYDRSLLAGASGLLSTPTMNAEIRAVLADTTVFCLSETHDNLLMWSHYAQNHTGVVIKSLALAKVDAPTIVAQPVRYSRQVPQ
jgi:hypothetical protein